MLNATETMRKHSSITTALYLVAFYAVIWLLMPLPAIRLPLTLAINAGFYGLSVFILLHIGRAAIATYHNPAAVIDSLRRPFTAPGSRRLGDAKRA
uniref:DUF485 domain-containing protein n=1 Tax=Panagrellus redivivus TaxID=6233 RepID=A0A7E4WDD3_PANRE